MVDRKSQETRHYCKACKIWLADNKPQREQHERGARHRAAWDAMLRDIARRNKEKAVAEASVRAEVATIEAQAFAAMGRLPQQNAASPLDRAALLDSIALATTAKHAPLAVRAAGVVSSSILNGRDSDEPAQLDSRGYGDWQETADPEKSADEQDDNVIIRKRERGGMRIGALDAADEEEAELREHKVVNQPEYLSFMDADDKTNGDNIEFKARGSSRSKRRRKLT